MCNIYAGYSYLSGIYTTKQIADKLNKVGFSTHRGKPVSGQFVSRFLKHPFYKGIIVSRTRDRTYKGVHKEMFSEEEWLKIRNISEENSFTAKPKMRNNPDFPLRHFTICSKCGSHITGNWSKGRSKKYSYYRCPNHAPSIPVEIFESEFIELLESVKPARETVERFTELLKAKYESVYKQLSSNTKTLENELNELVDKRKVLVQKSLDGVYDDDLFKEYDERLKDEIMVKKLQVSESTMEKIDIDTICEFASHFISNLSQTWRKADLEANQQLQQVLFPEGVEYCFPKFRTAKLSCLFNALGDFDVSEEHMGWTMGLEPTTSCATDRCSNQLS